MKRFESSPHKLFLLGLLVFLAACSSDNSDNVTFVVITDSPPTTQIQDTQVQVAQVATNTPLNPTEAPGMTPDVALRIGDNYFMSGYFENAVTTYQSILAQGDVPADIGASAAFNMGRAALRAGLFREAVEAMNYLIANFPDDFRAAQGYFLRGDAYLGLSQWQNAIDDFNQYLLLRPGYIDSYAHERIGDAYVNLSQLDLAFQSYDRASDSTRSLVPQLVLREKIANLYSLNGQVDAAVAEYDAILQVAENTAYRAIIEYDAAEALLQNGETVRATERMIRIFSDYPTQPEAYQAMLFLLEAGNTLDDYQQGEVSYYAGDYTRAIDAFNRFTSSTILSSIPAELQLFLGRSYRALGNVDAAQIAFQTLMQQYPQDPLFGEAALETGRTLFLNNEIDAAIARYLEISELYSYLPEMAAEALWRAGYLYGTTERPTDAQAIFTQLADRYPNTEQARSGLFFAASTALNAGDTFSAETLYSRLALATTGEDQAAAYLQVGQLARARGDLRAAESAFSSAVAAAPDSYYSARAADLLAGRAPFVPPDELVFRFDDLAEVTEAENWIRSVFGVTQQGPLWPLSPALSTDVRILRGRELWAVGAFDAAQDEFFDIIQEYSQDGLASYQLAVEMRLLGAYRASIFAAANVIISANSSTMDAPRYIARMRYPAYYRDVVLEASEASGVDPLLVFSLVRHESLFDSTADGGAGEKGLTQVIPSTGEYIAQQLTWPDYEHRDLYRPYAAIAFGIYYLQEQLERFSGNVYAALAGYNAGPGRSADWLALSGGDPDRFMDAITIDSVQVYIQSIYRNYDIYRELYGREATEG